MPKCPECLRSRIWTKVRRWDRGVRKRRFSPCDLHLRKRQLKLQKPTSPAGLVLVLLLVTDLLLIIAHILWLATPYFENYNYSLIHEGGFGETFQYFKAFWLAVIFVWSDIMSEPAAVEP